MTEVKDKHKFGNAPDPAIYDSREYKDWISSIDPDCLDGFHVPGAINDRGKPSCLNCSYVFRMEDQEDGKTR